MNPILRLQHSEMLILTREPNEKFSIQWLYQASDSTWVNSCIEI